MRHKFLVLHNSSSGWLGRHHYKEAIDSLRQAGAELEIVELQSCPDGPLAGDQTGLPCTLKAGQYDAVVAAGGDGTIHTVARGLLGGDTPLGIIPLGTGNVLAGELGIKSSANALVEMLQRGPVKNMPVGVAGEQIVLIVVGIGSEAQAVHHFEQAKNRRFGRVGFVLPVLQALGSQGGPPIYVTSNNRTLTAHWVIVTRVAHYAANLLLTPDADPFESDFHVVCFKGAGALVRLRQLTALFSGMAGLDSSIEIFRTTEVKIAGDVVTSVQIDGEKLGMLPLHIAVHKEKLPIIVPVQN